MKYKVIMYWKNRFYVTHIKASNLKAAEEEAYKTFEGCSIRSITELN